MNGTSKSRRLAAMNAAFAETAQRWTAAGPKQADGKPAPQAKAAVSVGPPVRLSSLQDLREAWLARKKASAGDLTGGDNG
jgi:hypothetical protein